jgi:Na+-translocating ferredoxin:NAD+ oxidoreductase RNF subunit RnfB
MMIVLITAIFAVILAFILGAALGFFKDFFAVPQDPLVGLIREALPGANCGACGFPGCDSYAKAIASGNAGISSCTVGGAAAAEKIAAVTGKTGDAVRPVMAVLACQGSKVHAAEKGVYTGIETCRGAKLSTGGTKLCAWGCIGFGDCVKICQFGALTLDRESGLPVVDYSRCTGCRMCITECPQNLFKSVPRDQKGAIILCSNRNPVRQAAAKACKKACLKCGLCEKNCPQQCIKLDSHIPVIDWEKCVSCGTCVEKCPTKAIQMRN